MAASPLPLSWHIAPERSQPAYRSVRLPASRTTWLQFADVPPGYQLPDHWPALLAQAPAGLLVRGCSPQLARALARQGADFIVSGQEAVFHHRNSPLAHRSIRELVRRGLRWGRPRELPYAHLQGEAWQELCHNSVLGGPARLEGLFRTDPALSTRFFVFQRPDGQWLGLLSLTQKAPGAWHTELLVRHGRAPVGIMEALVGSVYSELMAEGHREFSLGEVPFFGPTTHWKSRLLFRVGRTIRFAYNAEGLLRFKAKFRPEWRPLCLCTSRPLHLGRLAELFFASGAGKLTLRSLLPSLWTPRSR